MGWGIEVPCYLSKVTKSELNQLVEDTQEEIDIFKNDVLMHIAATPRDFKDELGYPLSWEEYIQCKFSQQWQDYRESIIRNYLAIIALENINEIKET
jgi:hypothetical protein